MRPRLAFLAGAVLFAALPARADPLPPGDPAKGETLFRACAVCHTLTPDGGRRAGPTLWRVFGRKAGAVEGYRYSPALQDSGIVWTEETVARLFEVGPDVMAPGSKMPLQTISDAQQRADLVAYLRRAAGGP
ncbi:MAG TPA: c-type cytochrome [Azospirillum sp.]|nr:c-type cytochrome [Azospirillum sp.]